MIPESGISSLAECDVRLDKNEITIGWLNRSYSESKNQTVCFHLNLPVAHTCGADDYAEAKIMEGIGSEHGYHTLETAVLFGFNERPVSEENATKYEQENTLLVRDPYNESEEEEPSENGTAQMITTRLTQLKEKIMKQIQTQEIIIAQTQMMIIIQ